MPCCDSSLLIISILAHSLIILNLNLLARMFVLFFFKKPFDMSNFDFTDGKCSPYVYKQKTHFFPLFKIKHMMALHTIQNVNALSSCYLHFSPLFIIFLSLAHYSKVQPPSFDLWYFMFSLLDCI
jgi:hypothetical protein